MVTEKRIGNKTVFLCDICGLGYADRATAQECENYCRTHAGSCSAEISKKAVSCQTLLTLRTKNRCAEENRSGTRIYKVIGSVEGS